MGDLPTIVGIGEILWDLLPSGKQMGGAPANFAYCSHLLGNPAVIASRIGADELGDEIRERLTRSNLNHEYLQVDSSNATGTVSVEVDLAGQPKFEIKYPAAWDFLEWDGNLRELAESADAVCFGSLAQRSKQSRATILKFLDATRSDTLRVFDVNLRQQFYSAENLRESMNRADTVKLNHQELPLVADLLGIPKGDFCKTIIKNFDLQLCCITRGENGSLLMSRSDAHEHPGFHVFVKDSVGAGDAFTAGLVHEYLRGSSLAVMSDIANRMGAWVASCAGGMPQAPAEGLRAALDALQAK